MKKLYIIVVMVLLFHLAEKAEAASLELSCNLKGLTCDNSGVYTLRGVDFVNVAGVQIVIHYDSTTLQSPNVTKGPLLPATAMINSDSSSITIAAISTVAKSGTDVLATIKFTPIGATPGAVSIQSHNITLLNGNPIAHDTKNPDDFAAEAAAAAAAQAAADAKAAADAAAAARVKADADAAAAAAASQADADIKAKTAADSKVKADAAVAAQAAADARAAAATAVAAQAQARVAGASVVGGASIGTITLPPDQMASTDRKTEYQPLVTDLRGDMTIPSSGASTAQTAAVQPSGKEKQQENRSVSYKSVLQLFKEFKGEKSAKGLIALFADGAVPNFTQDPPVALSDGITAVKLTLILKQSGNETPKFILQGASVKQMSSDEEQVAWTIDALPKKGVYDAKLTVIDGQNIMEFPLVVAPPVGPLVPKAQKFSEADFTLYLSTPAKFDLNKDEKFDSLDDYIFTANYIAALKIKPEKLKKDEPVPSPKVDVKTKDSQSKKEDKSK
jgi:hypothetical protein